MTHARKRRFAGSVASALARAAVVLATLAPAQRAGAAPPSTNATALDPATQEARDWVKLANQEYARANWQAALEAYVKAWNAKQHFAIAANLADVEYRLGKYRDAATHLKFYIAHLPPEYASQARAAEERLAQCRSHLIPVRVTVNVVGATVLLDGKELDSAELAEELWLEPGEHSLEAQKSGYVGARREFAAVLGESRDVALALVLARSRSKAPAQPARPAAPARARRASNSGLSPRTWVLVGGGALGAAAVGTGIVYALSASDADSRLRTERDAVEQKGNPALAATHSTCTGAADVRPSGCAALSNLREERNDARIVSGTAFIGAGVIGSLSLVTYFLWPQAAASGEVGSESGSRRVPSLRVNASASFRGVEWSGAF